MSLEVGSEEEVDGRTFFLYDGEYLVGIYPLDGSAGSETEHVELILVCEIEGKHLWRSPRLCGTGEPLGGSFGPTS